MKKLVEICRNGETSQVGEVSLNDMKSYFILLIDNLPDLTDELKSTIKTTMDLV